MNKTLVNLNVNVQLIGFTAEAPHARMGLLFHSTIDDMKAHAKLVKLQTCIAPGCVIPVQVGKQHAWTCEEHDPCLRRRERVRK